jgi:SulP family sulfate permease
MAEKRDFVTLLRASRGDAVVLLATFGLTLFRGLTEAIVVGFGLGALLFIHRMARTTEIARYMPAIANDQADDADERTPYDAGLATDPDIAVYRISGAFFFGATASVAGVLDSITERPRVSIIDFAAVPFIDSTAAKAIGAIAEKSRSRGVEVVFSAASPDIRRALAIHADSENAPQFAASLEDAVKSARLSMAAQDRNRQLPGRVSAIGQIRS